MWVTTLYSAFAEPRLLVCRLRLSRGFTVRLSLGVASRLRIHFAVRLCIGAAVTLSHGLAVMLRRERVALHAVAVCCGQHTRVPNISLQCTRLMVI